MNRIVTYVAVYMRAHVNSRKIMLIAGYFEVRQSRSTITPMATLSISSEL
jgi:hypothetical protein